MNAAVIVILIIFIILILAGIGVGLYFLLRPKSPPGGTTGPAVVSTPISLQPASNTPGPIIPVGNTGNTGATGTCPGCTPGPSNSQWANYTGGISGNVAQTIDGILSLNACQAQCLQSSTCQMVQYEEPNFRCYLQNLQASNGTNVSLLAPDKTTWFSYENQQINDNIIRSYDNVTTEDNCRGVCKALLLGNPIYNDQVLAEYNVSQNICLCISSTESTLQSYRIPRFLQD